MCPSPGCGAGLLPPDGSRRVECDRQLGCGFVFCRDCRRSYHQGACQAAPAPAGQVSQVSRPPVIHPSEGCLCVPEPIRADFASPSQGFLVGEEACLRGRWDQASLLFIQESTKRCPQCSVPVERNGKVQSGRSHVTHVMMTEACLCLPLQAAACTCSVLCVEQSGAGSVESPGTGSVWETTGLDKDLRYQFIFIIITVFYRFC